MKSYIIKGRKSIKEKTKRKIFSKTGMRCARCGFPLYYNSPKSTIDHIVPLSRGGVNNITNFIGLCEKCNTKKGDRIVLPSSYYMNMLGSGRLMKEADKSVIKWASNNITLDYIINNPFVFDEFYFTLGLNDNGLLISHNGNNLKSNKAVSVYKLEDNEIEDCIDMLAGYTKSLGTVLQYCVNNIPTYVFKNYNKVSQVESIITVQVIDSHLHIDVIHSIHYKTLATLLAHITRDIKSILSAIELDNVQITGLSEEAVSLLKACHEFKRLNDNTVIREIKLED